MIGFKPCEAKDAVYNIPNDFLRDAKYVFAREGAKATITRVDSGVIQIYEPSIGAFVVKYDPKRPPLVTPPTLEEINSLKLT